MEMERRDFLKLGAGALTWSLVAEPVCPLGNVRVVAYVPRVPEPELAVTKCLSSTVPSAASSSAMKFASNVFAVPARCTGLETVSNGSGDSTRIRGVSASKSARPIALPPGSKRTAVTVGNWVSV